MTTRRRLTPVAVLLAAALAGAAGCDAPADPPADEVALRPPVRVVKVPMASPGQQADAAFDLQVMYLEGVLGRSVPTPAARDRARWRQALADEYSALPADVRTELARTPDTLSALNVAWGRLSPAERDRVRDQARAAGGWQPAEAVMARQAPDGLRVEMFKVAVRNWPEFLKRVRAVPGVAEVEARAAAGPHRAAEYPGPIADDTDATDDRVKVQLRVTTQE